MDLIRYQCIALSLLLIIQAPFWTACPKDIQAQAAIQLRMPQGTSDGAGANGTANRPYESYIVDVTKLPAYQKYVSPISKKLDADEAKRRIEQEKKDAASGRTHIKPTEEEILFFDDYARIKTWYIAPVKLKVLPKEVLGVSFSLSRNQQFAIQTDKAIWVDRNYFEFRKIKPTQKMDIYKEQARILLHEIVMSLYLFKFKKSSEMVIMFSEAKGKMPNGMMSYLDEVDKQNPPPEPLRQLNGFDYENIRRVVDYMLSKGSSITAKELWLKMRLNGFDQRWFTDEEQENIDGTTEPSVEPEHFDLSADEMVDLINEPELTNNNLNLCFFTTSAVQKSCSISFKNHRPLQNANYWQGAHETAEIAVNDDNRTQIAFEFGLSDQTEIHMMHASGKDDVYYMAHTYAMHTNDHRQVGYKYRETYLFFRKESGAGKSSLQLAGVGSTLFVASKIVRDEQNQNRKMLRMVVPAPKDLSEDIVIIYRSEKDRKVIERSSGLGKYQSIGWGVE